jgi:hypothetical protein
MQRPPPVEWAYKNQSYLSIVHQLVFVINFYEGKLFSIQSLYAGRHSGSILETGTSRCLILNCEDLSSKPSTQATENLSSTHSDLKMTQKDSREPEKSGSTCHIETFRIYLW